MCHSGSQSINFQGQNQKEMLLRMFLWKFQQKADTWSRVTSRDRFHGLRWKCWQHVWDLALELFALSFICCYRLSPIWISKQLYVGLHFKRPLSIPTVPVQMVKFCRPKTLFLKTLLSLEYLVLRCSKDHSGFSFFCLWSFLIIVNHVGAIVLGFLFNPELMHEAHYSSLHCTKPLNFN